MRRAPLLVVLTGALLFLASLYLTWQTPSSAHLQQYFVDPGGARVGLADLFVGRSTIDGWSAGASDLAALAALLLAAAALVALLRPGVAGRLPLGRAAMLVAYVCPAVWLQTRTYAHQLAAAGGGPGFHTGYGAYLSAAGTAGALAVAFWTRRGELRNRSRDPGLVADGAAICLLVALLLPWHRLEAAPGSTSNGLWTSAAQIAAGLAIWLLVSRSGSAASSRLFKAALAALFTGAAFAFPVVGENRVYGSWVGLGAATALFLVALVLHPRERPSRPPWPALAVGGAAATLAASMFLPWVRACYADKSAFGAYAGRCVAMTEAGSITVPTATLLALGLAGIAIGRRRLPLPSIVPAAAAALLVATTTIVIARESGGGGTRINFAYGAIVGLVATAALLVLTAIRPRGVLPRLRASVDWRSAALRLPPLLASATFVALILVPEWNVLSYEVGRKLLLVELSWLTIAAMLLALWLVALWLQQIVRPAANDAPLVLLPVAMLALAIPDLVLLRHRQPTWGSGIAFGLCLVLTLFGHVERSDGLENVRVPEILRIDRI